MHNHIDWSDCKFMTTHPGRPLLVPENPTMLLSQSLSYSQIAFSPLLSPPSPSSPHQLLTTLARVKLNGPQKVKAPTS